MESHGVAVYRNSGNGYELLMVKKRCSYAFAEIASGIYSKRKDKLFKLISQTTFLEKSILLEKNFEYIYYYAFALTPSKLTNTQYRWYERSKRLFYKTFDDQLLSSTIYDNSSIDPPWEFPKGRLMQESSIQCAKREFIEETGHKDITILKTPPIIFDFSDNGQKYRYTIYIANSDILDIQLFKKHSHSEISEIKWVSAEHAKIILDPTTLNLYKKTLKKVKKINKKMYTFCEY